MKGSPDLRSRKHVQREENFLRVFSQLFWSLVQDDPLLSGCLVTRVSMSRDRSYVTIYFYVAGGRSEFEQKKKQLVLYKPSLRKAIAELIPARYTPDLVFQFDESYEKQRRIDDLLASVGKE